MKIKKKKKKEKKGKETPKKEGDERRQPVDWWRQKSRRSASLFAAASRRRWRQAARLTAGYSLTVNSLTFISFFYFFVSLSLSLALYSFFYFGDFISGRAEMFSDSSPLPDGPKKKNVPHWSAGFDGFFLNITSPLRRFPSWIGTGFFFFYRVSLGSDVARLLVGTLFFFNFQFFFPFFLSSRENRWQAAHR